MTQKDRLHLYINENNVKFVKKHGSSEFDKLFSYMDKKELTPSRVISLLEKNNQTNIISFVKKLGEELGIIIEDEKH